MSIPITLPGMHGPAAGFDEPFELLAGCHDRVRRSLTLLKRLADRMASEGADAKAQAAARDVLRYFDLAAPAHHEDEERHVVPLLAASADPTLVAAASRLLQDHEAIRAARRCCCRSRRRRAATTTPRSPPLPSVSSRSTTAISS